MEEDDTGVDLRSPEPVLEEREGGAKINNQRKNKTKQQKNRQRKNKIRILRAALTNQKRPEVRSEPIMAATKSINSIADSSVQRLVQLVHVAGAATSKMLAEAS